MTAMLFTPFVALTAPVNLCELSQQVIRAGIGMFAEFAILPTNDNCAGSCFPQILTPNIAVDIFDPLTGFDNVTIQVCDIGQKQGRTEAILHDVYLLDKTVGIDPQGHPLGCAYRKLRQSLIDA